MPFADLSTLQPLPKDNGLPVGTKGKEQNSTFEHIPTEEHDPSRSGNIPTNLASTAVDVENCTDHAQSHRGIGDQSQLTREDVNKTGWDPEFYPEGEIPGSPTELNSPTRYEVYNSREFPPFRKRSSRTRKLTRKAQEIEDMDNDIAKPILDASSASMPSRNRFIDNDGDLILPTIEQFYEMTNSDKEEWQQARSLF
ncbi:hypothetical protein F53441_2093 [Fusarium austroafricanum]|uniref:Uncharacterized protein n=1 Tax=Fusarium austroafricanum TaxID=2364996 RepID=A0A8H4NY85_9HYPO|nr:hypothetical protein F53441_2093 [Fusarium austroafricanum]